MTDRPEHGKRQSKGRVYTLTTALVFVILVSGADSECRLVMSGSLTANCVGHMANSATVSAAYAAVYGIRYPESFRAVFGRLIEVIIRIWARATGRTLPAAGVSCSAAAPVDVLPLPVVPETSGTAWWTVSRETLPNVLCVVVFVGIAVALVLKPPTPLHRGGVTSAAAAGADDQELPVQPRPETGQAVSATRPTTHTVVNGDTCVDIAKAYCTEAQ